MLPHSCTAGMLSVFTFGHNITTIIILWHLLFLFRYVGESYSNAQEAMEDAMCSFYSQSSVHHQRLHSPAIGQLAAVRGEEGDELARVQIIDVMTSNKVKVSSIVS